MEQWVYLNNDFIPAKQAALRVSDLSIQRGYGIFDYIRVCGTTPVFIDDHLDRFYRSAAAMHLEVSHNRKELKKAVQDLVERNALTLSGVRITLTGGYSEDGYTLISPNLIITQSSFAPPGKESIEEGMQLITKEHQRQLPQIKTIDYLMAIWLQKEVHVKGADEVLYIKDECVLECPRANIFAVTKEGTLITPATNILQGITRRKVIELAKAFCPVEERLVYLEDLKKSREVFITSTTKGILPIRRIDDTIFAAPRKITNLLQKELTHLLTQAIAEKR